MNKNYFYWGIGIVVVLFLIFTIPKYFTGNVISSGTEISGEIEKIEIIHFHSTNQCYSCITMGNLAEETVNTYFSNELKSGKIIFEHLNGDLSKNREKVLKYGATGSSLWIGIYYKDGTFDKEQNINVWYKINNKADYLSYLKEVIEGKLKAEKI